MSILNRRVWCSNRVLLLIFLCSLVYFLANSGILTVALFWRDVEDMDGLAEETVMEHEKLSIHRQIKWIEHGVTWNHLTTTCRNTKQGAQWITDDTGHICLRSELLMGGCCNRSADIDPQYTCEQCNNATGCCASFEHCVVCCLHPDQKTRLLNVIKGLSGKRLRGFLGVKDQFQLCNLKCRTSSHSVHLENRYKNSAYKYCYGLEPKFAYEDKAKRK